MLRYLLFRIFSILPALLLGTIALFFFRQLGPGASKWEERVEISALESGSYDEEKMRQAKADVRHRLQLDLPAFYISIQPAAAPESINPAFAPHVSEWVHKVSILSGLPATTTRLAETLIKMRTVEWNTAGSLSEMFGRQKEWLATSPNPEQSTALRLMDEIESSATSYTAFLPRISWHGTQNQFHLWLVKVVRGDLGRSWKNSEEVSAVIGRSLLNSIRFTVPAFLLIFASAYWLVIRLSWLKPRAKHLADQALYLIDLFPLFGWSLLLMIVFASGLVFSWFPSFVAGSEITGATFWHRQIWPYVLPVMALWLASFPYVTKQIDQAFQKTASQAFVLSAYARGLSEKMITEKYRLHYAMLPAITIFGEYILAVLSGALVVEVLFSIQGIGKLMTDAVFAQDFPVVTGIVLLLMVARMLAYLLTDLLYYWFDPRIRFST